MPLEPLTVAQRGALLAALAPFSDFIERVDLFGSRARGEGRAGSDADLMIYGRLDDLMVARIMAAIDESDISIAVDVHRFDETKTSNFQRMAVRDARPLFGKAELLIAASKARQAPSH